MFIPINRLPNQDSALGSDLEKRWLTTKGREARDLVLRLIREGAGEDFLQADFESGRLSILEDMWDLQGLQILGETFHFPDDDTFEAIDFSYGAFTHTTFENAVFQSRMRFGRIYGCTFKGCTFIYGHFFATSFEKCSFFGCDFIEGCGFTNCDFNNVQFESCYLRVPILIDCRFDLATLVGPLAGKPNLGFRGERDLKLHSDIYLGIADAYRSGHVGGTHRDYLFLALQSATRYNLHGTTKLSGFAKEYIFGYGLRPLRVLVTLAMLLLLGSLLFATVMPLRDAILFAAGALFTFGIHAEKLDILGRGYSIAYVILAFAGISLTALFAVVWARVFFADE